jgi:hypothetical protein
MASFWRESGKPQTAKDESLFWLIRLAMAFVADEADAQEAMRRFGARRGEVWIPGEIELIARFQDQDIRDEVANFKRQLDGCLSHNDAARVSYRRSRR